jgi:hypothetical protein
MNLEVNRRQLQTLRRALEHWSSEVAERMSQESGHSRHQEEMEHVRALLKNVDEKESRSGHMAWGPGDVEFLGPTRAK